MVFVLHPDFRADALTSNGQRICGVGGTSVNEFSRGSARPDSVKE